MFTFIVLSPWRSSSPNPLFRFQSKCCCQSKVCEPNTSKGQNSKWSMFGVRKGLRTGKVPKMGGLVVPQIRLKEVQSPGFFLVKGKENGKDCFCKASSPKQNSSAAEHVWRSYQPGGLGQDAGLDRVEAETLSISFCDNVTFLKRLSSATLPKGLSPRLSLSLFPISRCPSKCLSLSEIVSF